MVTLAWLVMACIVGARQPRTNSEGKHEISWMFMCYLRITIITLCVF